MARKKGSISKKNIQIRNKRLQLRVSENFINVCTKMANYENISINDLIHQAVQKYALTSFSGVQARISPEECIMLNK